MACKKLHLPGQEEVVVVMIYYIILCSSLKLSAVLIGEQVQKESFLKYLHLPSISSLVDGIARL